MGSSKAWCTVACKPSMWELEISLLDTFTHQAFKQCGKSLVGDLGLSIHLRMVGGAI